MVEPLSFNFRVFRIKLVTRYIKAACGQKDFTKIRLYEESCKHFH